MVCKSRTQVKAGRKNSIFPCHAVMKPISIKPIHNLWITLYGGLVWSLERLCDLYVGGGVDLHECSSTSLL